MDGIDDSIVSNYFLKEIAIAQNNKVLRQGQLLLFYVKDFYLHFTLKTQSGTKQFEIPYPFKTKKTPTNILLLDYALSSFKAEYSDIEKRIKNIGYSKKSRYYNSIIRIYTV